MTQKLFAELNRLRPELFDIYSKDGQELVDVFTKYHNIENELNNQVKNRIQNRIQELQHMVNCDEYDGYSQYYIYTKEQMPINISNIRWALNNLCHDFFDKEESANLNEIINNIIT